MKVIGIIGAGAAGLCALRHVRSNKDFTAIIWEHANELGGTWVYTPNIGNDEHGYPIHSSMYNSLRTNLPKEIMAFPDYPFTKSENSFVHHSEVLQYLKDYAHHFELESCIKFNHRVNWILPIEENNQLTRWKVTVKNLLDGATSTTLCDYLIIGNGHYSTPKYPQIENLDEYQGTKIHSHYYRTSEPFRNSTVIVLGASSSGMDLSLEIANVADKVYLSHNFPVPIPSKLPSNLQQVKGIKAAKEDGFTLLDGTFIQADTILYCTGYEYTFPFLSPACGISVEDNQVKPLHKHLVNATFPTMGFLGIPFQIVPFPIFDVQSRYIIEVFKGEIHIPSLDSILQEMNTYSASKRHYHFMGSKQWSYMDDLESEMDKRLLSPHFRKIFDIVWLRRLFFLATYKNFKYSYSRKDSGAIQVKETLDGISRNTYLDLTCYGAKQILILLIFYMNDVLKRILNFICNK